MFIYECGKLEWGEATIGWSDTRLFYEADYSRSSYSTRAGCLNYFDSNAIIYRLDKSELNSILEVLFLNDVCNYTFASEFGALYSVRFLYLNDNYTMKRK